MNGLRKLSSDEVDQLQVYAQILEELAADLRSRAVESRQLCETGLDQTLAGLQETVALIVENLEGRA